VLEMVKELDLGESELAQELEVQLVLLFLFYILIFLQIAVHSRYSH
jgi:hypothetical protein